MAERKIALLVGVSEYGEGIPSLSAPPNDVTALQRVLQNLKLGAFDEIIPLINPDLVLMKQSIQRLFKNARKEDLILLFFSGHGITDDDNHLYLATCLTARDDFEATSVEANFIQKLSKNCYAKRQVIVLDCCYSGAFANGWQSKSVGLDIKRELGAEGRVVLTSSTATQVSHQHEDASLSLYTQYLVEGIETGAADENGDGKIYVHELHKYAKSKVQAIKPNMKPDIILDDEGYDILLFYVPREPEMEYRQLVEKYVDYKQVKIIDREAEEILEAKRQRLGISREKAKGIIESVLEPAHIRLENLKRYEEKYIEKCNSNFPIDEQTLERLKEWRYEVLGLEDQDVHEIEEEIYQLFLQQQPDATSSDPQDEIPSFAVVLEHDELTPLLLKFLEHYSTWFFNASRIRGWGAKQPGYGLFGNYSTKEIDQCFQQLFDSNKLRIKKSKRGTTLYAFK
ncbi:caspase family protein [Microcoleus sp. N9_B2]|uniref:caspase, EACC1-associated type n=1 Tax=unclassified Microcoleus TaxID=2642155 RepID=UPI002FD042DB